MPHCFTSHNTWKHLVRWVVVFYIAYECDAHKHTHTKVFTRLLKGLNINYVRVFSIGWFYYFIYFCEREEERDRNRESFIYLCVRVPALGVNRIPMGMGFNKAISSDTPRETIYRRTYTFHFYNVNKCHYFSPVFPGHPFAKYPNKYGALIWFVNRILFLN